MQDMWWTRAVIIPLRGPSCKLRLFRFSAKLKFQDGPSVAISLKVTKVQPKGIT